MGAASALSDGGCGFCPILAREASRATASIPHSLVMGSRVHPRPDWRSTFVDDLPHLDGGVLRIGNHRGELDGACFACDVDDVVAAEEGIRLDEGALLDPG